jgi:hypothetical protein
MEFAASLLARYVSWISSRTARDFSPHTVKISPCGKFNDIDAKHKQKSAILPVRELAKDRLFNVYTLVENLPQGERFLLHGDKNLSPCGNLSRTRTGLGANPIQYILNFKI